MKKFITTIALLLTATFLLVGCGVPSKGEAPNTGMPDGGDSLLGSTIDPYIEEGVGGNEFSQIIENPFVSVAEAESSAMRLSVSTSSYTYSRMTINNGELPIPDAVRIEEYINYFDYDVVKPTDGTFSTYTNIYPAPWNTDNLLMRFTLQAKEIESTGVSSNLVFLIDTSGSMSGEDRLGLVQKAFSYLAKGLTANDRVSIITYSGSSKVVLNGESGSNTQALLSAMDGLEAVGGTNGAGALDTAYRLANESKIEGGNNRIILATDGDFNIGNSSQAGITEQIKSYSDMGIYLTCIGVGNGNYHDTTMENLAKHGNGQAYYIDTESEAKRVFTEGLTSTLFTVAEQAKAQITFNSELVSEYRLIGYDNLLLTTEEYEDENTDAGEIGSGHTVTIMYEIVPKVKDSTESYATAEVKYVNVDTKLEEKFSSNISIGEQTADDTFIACVIEEAMLLRGSQYKADASASSIIARLEQMELTEKYRLEFLELAKKAQLLQANLSDTTY